MPLISAAERCLLPGLRASMWSAMLSPVLSLDAIRHDLEEEATGNQGRVVSAAREKARTFLREGADFVWNATNLSRELRRRLVDLFSAYNARVRIVYVEAPGGALWRRNRSRSAPVPEAVIRKLMDRWDVPSPSEAHEVEWWIGGRRVAL